MVLKSAFQKIFQIYALREMITLLNDEGKKLDQGRIQPEAEGVQFAEWAPKI